MPIPERAHALRVDVFRSIEFASELFPSPTESSSAEPPSTEAPCRPRRDPDVVAAFVETLFAFAVRQGVGLEEFSGFLHTVGRGGSAEVEEISVTLGTDTAGQPTLKISGHWAPV